MTGRFGRSTIVCLLLAVAVGSFHGLSSAANPNERYVKPGGNVQDADASRNSKLWVLDFKFKDPRLIKVNVPGRGQKVCWYLWYQVINAPKPGEEGEPHTFVPEFELKTHDTNMVYRDHLMPAVQDAIIKIEDPTGYYKIRNSVTISNEPIPVSLPKATPRAVTGVAIWCDPNDINPDDDAATRARKEKMPKLADTNRFSIFVAGLSNGWAETDPIPPDKKPVVRRKTLQLNFKRMGDRALMRSEDIQFIPPAQWIYRGAQLLTPLAPPPPAKADKGDKADKE
jgi:hypothetical protein